MLKPELVLSNTVTFFSGSLEKFFKTAQRLSFKYAEIVAYRWTTPEEILSLEEKYAIQVVGIHMPQWWSKRKWNLLMPIWEFYLGSGEKNPGPKIAGALSKRGRNPYLLFHSNVAREMGESKFREFASSFNLVVENIPGDDPAEIQKKSALVYDPGHYGKTLINLPSSPEVLHISYTPFHILPNLKQRQELAEFIQNYQPRYVVIETNPWISVMKGKLILEKILNPPGQALGIKTQLPSVDTVGDRKEINPD